MSTRRTVSAIAIATLLFLPTAAHDKAARSKAPKSASSAAEHAAQGTIAAWNEQTKEVTLQFAAGDEEVFSWDENTAVHGTPTVGEHAQIDYTKDKQGKMLATKIRVGTASGHGKKPHSDD